MENKENLIVLIGYPMLKSGLINDFLKHSGHDKEFEIVQASISFVGKRNDGYREERITTCLALKPVDEKVAFIYNIKGAEKILEELAEYERERPFNKGRS
jgi:hypothetical protein